MTELSNQAELKPAPEAIGRTGRAPRARARGGHGALDPVLMMLVVLALAIGLTWIVPSGAFVRKDHNVFPGTFHVVPKQIAPQYLIDSPSSSDEVAYPPWSPRSRRG